MNKNLLDWTFKGVLIFTAVLLLYLIAVVGSQPHPQVAEKKAGEKTQMVKDIATTPVLQKTGSLKVASTEIELKPLPVPPPRKVSPKDTAAGQGEAKDGRYRILITGDSMGDGLYVAMLKTKKLNNYNIKYVPWYGSNTSMWGKIKKLEGLIGSFKPSLVIFTLGSNELFVPGIRSREKYVQEIVRQMGNVNYVWVGPPNWKEDTGINELISKHASDRFFVSKYMKFERAKDGAHPTFKACETWSDTITRWINQKYALNFIDLATMKNNKQLPAVK